MEKNDYKYKFISRKTIFLIFNVPHAIGVFKEKLL